MKALAIGLAAVWLWSASGTEAHASCLPASLAQQIASADVIAEGVVRAERERGIHEFAVDRVLKGHVSGTLVVRASAVPGAISSVDLDLKSGGTYTLYLVRDLDAFTTSACSASHEGRATSDETTSLGAGSTAGSPSDDSALPGSTVGLLLAAILVAPPASSQASVATDEVVILSTYRSYNGANNRPRSNRHAGVDFGGHLFDPLLPKPQGVRLRHHQRRHAQAERFDLRRAIDAGGGLPKERRDGQGRDRQEQLDAVRLGAAPLERLPTVADASPHHA